MNAVLPIEAAAARLPATYEHAKTALSECVQLDECQTWADKAAALASYAKQSKDEELMKMAIRIRDRAIRRAGELLQQIEPQKGGDRKSAEYQTVGTGPLITRKEAAQSAGMSERQAKTAVQVANVPAADFDRAVDAPKPATVTQLAAMGTKPAPSPVIDLKGRDPSDFNRCMHFVAEFEDYAKAVRKFDLPAILPILTAPEMDRIRAAISTIDAVHDRIITRI